MAREDPNPDDKQYVTPYGGGLSPTYFTGTATRSDIPYSKWAKFGGFLVALGLTLFMVWFIISFISAQS